MSSDEGSTVSVQTGKHATHATTEVPSSIQSIDVWHLFGSQAGESNEDPFEPIPLGFGYTSCDDPFEPRPIRELFQYAVQ